MGRIAVTGELRRTFSVRNKTIMNHLFRMLAAVAMSITVPTVFAVDAKTYISRTTEGNGVLQLQKMIADAVAVGQHKVLLPAGRFHLATERVVIRNIHDLTLEGAGPEKTTLVTDMWAGTAVAVLDSQRITFRGFAVDREPVPFVQATITRISDVKGNTVAMDFEVHDGYPRLTDRVVASLHGCGQFFAQSTRRLKRPDRWFGPQPGKNVVRIDDAHGRLLLSADWKARVAEGDYVVLESGNGGAFVLFDSDSIRMEDVRILASGSLGVGARFLTGENYFRYTIRPGPTPVGAKQARLIATNADGMQYIWCPGAVTFDRCDFSFTGDDGINISIQVLKVLQVQSPTRFRTSIKMESSFVRQMVALSKPGDIVRPERFGTFEPLGDVPLKSIVYEGSQKTETGRELAYVTVELQQPPAGKVAVGDVLAMRRFLPEHFAIRNSYFRDTRARGLLISASNGVIENNTIERTALAGMSFLQEIAGAGGADWVSDIVVRNNTIRDVCFNDGDGLTAAAALQVLNRPAVFPGEGSLFYPWVAAHRNISVVGNTIDGSDGAGILINGLDGGEVRDNTVKNTNLRRGGREVNFATAVPMSLPYAITVMNSRRVRVEGNKVSDLGPHAKGKVGDVGTYPAAVESAHVP